MPKKQPILPKNFGNIAQNSSATSNHASSKGRMEEDVQNAADRNGENKLVKQASIRTQIDDSNDQIHDHADHDFILNQHVLGNHDLLLQQSGQSKSNAHNADSSANDLLASKDLKVEGLDIQQDSMKSTPEHCDKPLLIIRRDKQNAKNLDQIQKPLEKPTSQYKLASISNAARLDYRLTEDLRNPLTIINNYESVIKKRRESRMLRILNEKERMNSREQLKARHPSTLINESEDSQASRNHENLKGNGLQYLNSEEFA